MRAKYILEELNFQKLSPIALKQCKVPLWTLPSIRINFFTQYDKSIDPPKLLKAKFLDTIHDHKTP